MNPRNTGILAVVALALAAFVYFYEIRGEEARQAAEEAEKRLFPALAADAIDELRVVGSDGGEARVVRREGSWQMLEPVAFPGDAVTLDGMTSTLAQLTSERVISEPQELAEYGLGDDAGVIRFSGAGADFGLRLGKQAPVGGSSYVSLVEEGPAAGEKRGAVYLVPTFKVKSLQHPVDDLRDRRVMDFDGESVDRIVAAWPDGGVTLERGEDGWRVVLPIEDVADDAAVGSLLSNLSFLRAEGFLDEVPDDADFGLDEPEFEVALRFSPEAGDAEAHTLRFALGALQSDGKRLARGAQPSLYRVRGNLLEDLPRKLVSYRFKQLARFDPSDAEAFEVAFQDPSAGQTTLLRGEREDGIWTTTPRKMAAGMAGQLLASVATLQASDIVAESMGPAELAQLGLSPPYVAIRVEGAAPEEGEAPLLAEVHLGRGDVEGGIAARRVDRDTVFRIDPTVAEHIPISAEAFENRFVSSE